MMDFTDMAANDLYHVTQGGTTLIAYIDWLRNVIDNPSSVKKLQDETFKKHGIPFTKEQRLLRLNDELKACRVGTKAYRDKKAEIKRLV